MWEALLEDETMENIREYAWKANDKIIVVKAEMIKISLKDKVANVSEVNHLQQEVQVLRDQERTRNYEVAAHHLEAAQVIKHI